jgi:cysteine desulfurase
MLEPWHHGDGREGGLRAGIENVAGIVGLGTAANTSARALDDSQVRLEKLRNRLFSQLQRDVGDELIVHGRLAQRLPNTLCVSFPLVSAQDLLARAAEICASTGAAWHSSTAAISPTLAAMGVSPEHARGTVRFSVG